VLPSASFTMRFTAIVAAAPAGTDDGTSVTDTAATTPLNVTFTTLAWSATIVCVSDPVERSFPAPPG